MHYRLVPITVHLPTHHTCWSDIVCRGIFWFLRYVLASPPGCTFQLGGYLVYIITHLVLLRHVSYVLFERPSPICPSVGFLSPILNLIAPSPPPMSPSPTAGTTSSTYAANGGADHAPTCAYRPVSFPLGHIGRHNIALLSSYFDIFQWRVEATSHRRLCYTLARTC